MNKSAGNPLLPFRRLTLSLLLLLVCFQATASEETLTLNLKDADIRALISTVSEMTGKNFVIDPRVKGKVTVISSSPTNRDQVYEIFLSVLKIHGFATIPSGDVIKIIPNASAKQDSIQTVSASNPGSGDTAVTRVIQIQNVAAVQLVPILRPLMPQQAHLAAHADGNLLIISDSAANVNRVVSIIQRIDLASDQEIEVITVEYANAADLVQVLNATKQSGAKGGASAQQPTMLVADARTNSILLGGNQRARLRMRALILHLDTPVSQGEGGTEVIYLQHAVAADLATVLTGVGNQQLAVTPVAGAKKATTVSNQIAIQADEAANALVLSAPPEIMRLLKHVIRQLDIRRAQVLVEGIIAEVSNDKALELGVEWRTPAKTTSGIYGVTKLPLGTTEAGTLSDFPGTIASGFSLGYFRGGDLRALLNAFAGDSNTNILSTPTILTLDNEEATIHIGQNVPFVTGQYTSSSTTSDDPFQTIERHDVGIMLTVTPQISEGDTVKLIIAQEVSSVESETSGAGLITNQRSITTTVLVDDNQTIVLGGLITDDLQESISKVPLLGDLPIIGALFRSQKTTLNKTNLMVFLRPRIIRDRRTGSHLTSSKYRSIHDLQLKSHLEGAALMPNAVTPMLPALMPADEAPSSPNKVPQDDADQAAEPDTVDAFRYPFSD